MRTFSFLFCNAAFLAASLLLGQDTSSVSGLITDPTGAAVPKATVKLVSVDQGWNRTTTSDDNGLYSFPTLKVGRYEIHVDKTGFQPLIRENINLDVAVPLRVDLGLTVGDTNQTVTVTSESPILDTATANKQTTFTGNEVLALPNQARLPILLAYAQAGTVNISGGAPNQDPTSGDRNLNRISFNGGRDLNAAVSIDGMSDTTGDARFALAFPSIEATQEAQIVANSFDARYGKSDGAVINFATKGGSKDFHGTAFGYLRNDVLDANDWASNRAGVQKALFQRSQFGANLGGPISRSKHVYFFASYDGLREATPNVLVATVPTALERQGNFSQTYNADGSLSTIYNPFSTIQNSQGQYTRTPFTNNIIPSSMLDSVGANVVNLYPLPTSPGDGLAHANNFAASAKEIISTNRLDLRFDWTPSEKYALYGHLTRVWYNDTIPTFFRPGADYNRGGSSPAYFATIGNTFVLSPTWLLNVTVASSRMLQNWLLPSIVAGVSASTIGVPRSQANQLAINSLPGFSFEGYSNIGYPEYLNFPRQNQELKTNSTKTLHSHTLEFGFSAENDQLNVTDQISALFAFDRGLTSGPVALTDSASSGNSIGSLLLGSMSSASAPYTAAPAQTQKYIAWYAQDSWKANDRLTLQIGLRYDIQFPRTERFNRFNYFDFNVSNPLSSQVGIGLKGGLIFRSSANRNLWNTDYSNIAPRMGLAYKLSDRLVFRSGYGLYYVQTTSSAQGTDDGYSINTTGITTQGNGGLVPANLLSNPFPQGVLKPTGASLGLLTDVGTTVEAYQLLHPTPYVQLYNANVQYEITTNSILEVGYLGSQGRKLQLGYSNGHNNSADSGGLNINQLDPSYLSLGPKLNQQVPNPFYGSITSGPLSGQAIPYYQLLLPYPQYTAVYLGGETPGASSSYNALTVKYNYRFRQGLAALITYQWSKAIDDTSETQGWETKDQPRNAHNVAAERSVSAHDVPQYFTAAVVWELPIGRGRSFGSHMNKLAESVIGGWQVSTIVRLESGLPLQFTCANTLAVYGFQACRPNITSLTSLASVHRTPDQWFNTSSAVISAPAAYTIGDAPRYVPNERWGGFPNADLTLKKSFSIRENIRIVLQASAYNISNTPDYGKANTNVSSPSFGKITSMAGDSIPRNVEFALRVQF